MMSQAVWPVFVRSRGRPRTCVVPDGLSARVVVEPHELDAYQAHHPERAYLVLPESNRGLVYVNNWIKQHALEVGIEWYWLPDDDIPEYHRVVDGRLIGCSAQYAYTEAQRIITAVPLVGQGGMEYRQFAWSARRPYSLNSYCSTLVAINTALTPNIWWRDAAFMKEDRDYTLNVLAAGLWTVRATHVAFANKAWGQNAEGGGQCEHYDARCDEEGALALAKLWPGIVRVERKRNGRVDAIINWRAFRQKVPA